MPSGLRERVVDVVRAAAAAEFKAYASLPRLATRALAGHFTDGPARRRIVNLLRSHKARGWVISNDLNPSTSDVLSARFVRLDGSRAIVATEEYWYLRWFESATGKYRKIYNKHNKQTYVLVNRRGKWLVDGNIYPSTS